MFLGVFMNHQAPVQEINSNDQQPSTVDELTRIFNTALVSSRVEEIRDYSAELYKLMDTPAFETILNSVRTLARQQCLSDRDAAELIIQTFRKLDRVWTEYVLHEGVERLKSNSLG